MEGARRHGDLCVVGDGLLGCAVKLVQRQFPSFVDGILFRGCHCGGGCGGGGWGKIYGWNFSNPLATLQVILLKKQCSW